MFESTLNPRSQHPLSTGCCTKCLGCVAEKLLSTVSGTIEATQKTVTRLALKAGLLTPARIPSASTPPPLSHTQPRHQHHSESRVQRATWMGEREAGEGSFMAMKHAAGALCHTLRASPFHML